MDKSFASARAFIEREARLLEQRIFATAFLGEAPEGVVDALRGYQNGDGGFGHGLEPDKACPASLPVDVEVALRCLVEARTTNEEMVSAATRFLEACARKAGDTGAVPLAYPVIETYPRAEHWSEWTYVPAINPTGGLVGLSYALGHESAWRDRASAYCWTVVESGERLEDAHSLLEALVFLEHVPDQARAEACASAIAENLESVPMVKLDPNEPGYGLTPLHFAPQASSRLRALFPDDLLEVHLEHLLGAQEDDGGWPIAWEPPSAAARLAWRGIETLSALLTLCSYGRLEAKAD